MRVRYYVITLSLTALMLCFASLPAKAVEPIKVLNCDPEVSATAIPDYVSGYFPGSPYFWWDVYGDRFTQPAFVAAKPTLNIDYMNLGPIAAHVVEFGLVSRGDLVAEVRDVGTFSPNVEIKHSFGLDPNVFPLGTGLPICAPLRIVFVDHTVWINPNLPRLASTLFPHD
jgi:hypothetical protein